MSIATSSMLLEQKRQLRKTMNKVLALVGGRPSDKNDEVQRQSDLVMDNVMKTLRMRMADTDDVNTATTTTPTPSKKNPFTICAYLAMEKEIQTDKLISTLLTKACRVCVPVCVDDRNMKMVELAANEDANAFARDKWGIPILPGRDERPEMDPQHVDVVLTPGLAFDRLGRRIGRGKGYYDTYLTRVDAARKAYGLRPCFKIGIAFTQQLIDEVPTSSQDVVMDVICVPDEIINVIDGDTIQ